MSGFAQLFFVFTLGSESLFDGKLADGARLGGEVDADAEELAGIGSIGTSIALLFDLP